MDPTDVAPMVVMVTGLLVTGLVLLLRPISTRLGKYLEVLAEERRRHLAQEPMGREDAARMVSLMDSLDQRLRQIEERQDFTDKLLVDRTKTRA